MSMDLLDAQDQPIRDTYLSVDLDYWTCCPEEHVGEQKSLRVGAAMIDERMSRFIAQVLEHVPQVGVLTHHDQIVPFVNGVFEHPILRVINVDFHSDLPDWGPTTAFPPLNEGTWGLYVSAPHTKVFEWRSHSASDMPSRRCCSDNADTETCPFVTKGLTAFAKATHKLGLGGIQWDRIAGAAIVVSPDWWFANTTHIYGCSGQKGMPDTRELLKLKSWPTAEKLLCKRLKGKPVPDIRFQEYLAKAYRLEKVLK